MVEARLFQALSDATRLKILSLLAREPMNVSKMVGRLGCAQPAVSRHLRVLREADLIHDTRRGKEVEYSLNHGELGNAAAYLEKLVGTPGLVAGGRSGERPTGGRRVSRARKGQPSGVRRGKGRRRGTKARSAAAVGSSAQGSEAGRLGRAAKPEVATAKPKKRAERDSLEFTVERKDDTMDDFLL